MNNVSLDYSQSLKLSSLEIIPVSAVFNDTVNKYGELSTSSTIISSTASGETGAIESDDVNIVRSTSELQTKSYEDAKATTESKWQQFVQAARDKATEAFNNDQNRAFGGYVGALAAIYNQAAATLSKEIMGLTDGMADFLDETTKGSVGSILANIADAALKAFQPYTTGEEYSFAANRDAQVSAWASGRTASKTYNVGYLPISPIDIGGEKGSLYGSLVLGTPFLFGEYSDPVNRTMVNSFVKDGRILSLIPGLPKYNGSNYSMSRSNNYAAQTKTFDEMMAYLMTNGIGKNMQSKDRRYYTFDSKYSEYYKYLEAYLNTIYARMGLASADSKKVSLLSFFDDPDTQQTLKSSLQNGIGFFVDSVDLSESIDNSQTSIGSSMAADTNAQSDTYQKLNYLTGMGTGGALAESRRAAGLAYNVVSQAKDWVGTTFHRTGSVISSSRNPLVKIATGALALVQDLGEFSNNNDLGQQIEQFTVTNGMKVMYPELWQESSFNKSIAFNFNFASPYGDPASIFKYVYVPFFSLLTFAMPRMAADNGYVSPFFIRASVPGLFNSDLAMISNMTWNRGGGDNQFTKDGLPLKISGTVTITDLYPYLSSINHVSCLSFNPSYSIWMDSFAGQSAIYEETETDPLNTYFKQMINRISGTDAASLADKLWNRTSKIQNQANSEIFSSHSSGISQNISNQQIYWMKSL